MSLAPAFVSSFEKAIEKQALCAAPMSSSGLVVPPASSDVRFGQETSKVPSFELVSSTLPDPSCRLPLHVVVPVRVAMSSPSHGGFRPDPTR
jgi:hypothetical protein